MESLLCPKCQGEMEEGFMTDYVHGRGAVIPEQWMPGVPQESFWFGTKLDSTKLRQVKTFHCRECGYLESYAKK